jgi:hypothetical protein
MMNDTTNQVSNMQVVDNNNNVKNKDKDRHREKKIVIEIILMIDKTATTGEILAMKQDAEVFCHSVITGSIKGFVVANMDQDKYEICDLVMFGEFLECAPFLYSRGSIFAVLCSHSSNLCHSQENRRILRLELQGNVESFLLERQKDSA